MRELKALIELDEEPWAKTMSDLLVEANETVKKARQAGETALSPPVVAGFLARYGEAVRAGLAFHRSLPAASKNAQEAGPSDDPDITCSSA